MLVPLRPSVRGFVSQSIGKHLLAVKNLDEFDKQGYSFDHEVYVRSRSSIAIEVGSGLVALAVRSRKAHQLLRRPNAELMQQVAPVRLHGTGTDCQLPGDFLAGSTGEQVVEHFPFAFRQRGAAPTEVVSRYTRTPAGSAHGQSGIDAVQQRLLSVRLLEDVDGAGPASPEPPSAHRRVR
jgi:hypothetical protein